MKRYEFKHILHRLGLYPQIRHLHRLISSSKRREKAETKLFYRKLVSSGDLCFDIGANVGQTTEALIGCGAKVIAVEPNPLCSPVLQWQFGRNPDVTLVKKAVGSEPGTAVLNFNGTDSTASMRKDWPFTNRSSVTVEVTTLDELISQYGRPKLCKVDVEGFEVEVFKGLTQPIPIIYFEAHQNELDRARQVLATISRLGNITATNLTDLNNTTWLFDNWVTIDVLLERLEAKTLHIANVVLKMAS